MSDAGLSKDNERNLVRELARQVAEIAAEPRMAAIQKRWRDVNALRKPDRAPVYCRPVGCWPEILPEASLVCQDPWLRGIEHGFRRTLYKRTVDDDTPVDPWFGVSAVVDMQPASCWGVDIGRHQSGVAGGAWAYDPPLKTEADFDRLKLPSFTYNEARTQDVLEQSRELLDDILPVKLTCGSRLSATLGNPAADLRGLEQMMVDMIVQPELMHRLMAYLRDAVLANLDQIAATGLVTPNNTGPMACSDPIDPGPAEAGYTFKDCWCFANSQEFDQVSPAMWEEFCLAYQKPILERFGLAAYGCCENLTHKIDGVLSIPNLRIFVCSAWTALDTVLERTSRDRTCIMWRQKASDVVFPDDTTVLRRDLEEGTRKLSGRCYQIVLRELQTLAGHPNRLHEWTTLAKAAAEANA